MQSLKTEIFADPQDCLFSESAEDAVDRIFGRSPQTPIFRSLRAHSVREAERCRVYLERCGVKVLPVPEYDPCVIEIIADGG